MHTLRDATLRQRHIEALTRRAALHQGRVRQLLDQRLQQLQAAAPAVPAPPSTPAATAAGPLTELLAEIAQFGGALPDGLPSNGTTQAAPAARELKAVRDYRSTWSRLSVEQRVQQALARVPDNAGPLNTERLVHQALHALHALSPAYLHRLVTQVEALLWLEQVGQGGSGGERAAQRPAARPAIKPATRRSPR